MYNDTTIYAIDFSHAGEYTVTIRDPNQSETSFSYTVTAGTPSNTLHPNASNLLHGKFCGYDPSDSKCPDGSTLTHSILKQYGSNLVGDGKSYYNFDFSFRDQYGNIPQGSIQIQYDDHIKDVQYAGSDGIPFVSWGAGLALNASGSVWNMGTLGMGQDSPTTHWLSLAIMPTIRYGFSSYAPTSPTGSLSMKQVLYRDAGGTISTFPHTSIGSPITFLPWYTTSLAVVGDILIGQRMDF